jgi:anthranilate/para-aminobenzoate synthase component II
VFKNLPAPFEANRYHSLIVERPSLPDELEITAETADGLIMGLRHRTYPIEGVQFHPESILTPVGKDLLRNFLEKGATHDS